MQNKIIKKLIKIWFSIPAWLRSIILEIAELVGAVVVGYAISVASGEQNFSIRVLLVIILKTIAKTLRAHPDIPVPDYVNPQPTPEKKDEQVG